MANSCSSNTQIFTEQILTYLAQSWEQQEKAPPHTHQAQEDGRMCWNKPPTSLFLRLAYPVRKPPTLGAQEAASKAETVLSSSAQSPERKQVGQPPTVLWVGRPAASWPTCPPGSQLPQVARGCEGRRQGQHSRQSAGSTVVEFTSLH